MRNSFLITGEQIRAARALARIEQVDLAKRCSLSLETIKRLERIRGPVDANIRTLQAILQAFEALGVQLDTFEDGGSGVSRMPAEGAGGPSRRRAPDNRGGELAQPLHRLIYYSTANAPAGEATRVLLDDIFRTAAARTKMKSVTGVLLAHESRLLQALEGPKDAVQEVYGAISADRSQGDLHLVESRTITERQFTDWTLFCGAFPSDRQIFEREPAMAKGFHPEILTPSAALGLLGVARDLQRTDPRIQRTDVLECVLASKCLDRTCGLAAAVGEEFS
jgi:transcriptional regulator with XRE-family HTH domain